MSSKIKAGLALALPLLLTLLLSVILQIFVLSDTVRLTAWMAQFGIYFVLVYIVIQSATIIIAPLGGYFAQVAAIALLGPLKGLTLIYFVTTPLYLINFFISKRYGRPLVEKIVGKEALAKMDHYVSDAGIVTLLILKILQRGNFDFISYAYGLTKVNFKTFFWINLVAGIPAIIVEYFVFSKIEGLTAGIVLINVISILLAALSIYIVHKFKHPRNP